jgi:hypothetical protein
MEFQFEERVAKLTTFFDNIEAGHLNGKPRHIADPEKSMFDIISYDEFQGLSTRQIQDRLRLKNIVVTGLQQPNVKFDKAGLREFCPLDRYISIQGTNSPF